MKNSIIIAAAALSAKASADVRPINTDRYGRAVAHAKCQTV